jgi:hypothetical protein
MAPDDFKNLGLVFDKEEAQNDTMAGQNAGTKS